MFRCISGRFLGARNIVRMSYMSSVHIHFLGFKPNCTKTVVHSWDLRRKWRSLNWTRTQRPAVLFDFDRYDVSLVEVWYRYTLRQFNSLLFSWMIYSDLYTYSKWLCSWTAFSFLQGFGGYFLSLFSLSWWGQYWTSPGCNGDFSTSWVKGGEKDLVLVRWTIPKSSS